MLQNDVAKGKIGIPDPAYAGMVNAVRFTIPIAAGDTTLGNIFEIGGLPGNCRVVDMILDSDDLDTHGTPLITLNVGIMSGTFGDNNGARTCGAEFFSASAVGKAGTTERASLKTAFRVAPSDTIRSIGVEVAAAAATGAGGTIGLTMLYATG